MVSCFRTQKNIPAKNQVHSSPFHWKTPWGSDPWSAFLPGSHRSLNPLQLFDLRPGSPTKGWGGFGRSKGQANQRPHEITQDSLRIRFCMPEKDGRDLPDHNPIRIDRLGWDFSTINPTIFRDGVGFLGIC